MSAMLPKKSPIFVFKSRSSAVPSKATYYSLIEEAISSSPMKTMFISEIYDFIAKNYFEFMIEKSRWQNSVRHALSFKSEIFQRSAERSSDKKIRGHRWSLKAGYKKWLTQRRATAKKGSGAKKVSDQDLTQIQKVSLCFYKNFFKKNAEE